MFKLYTNHSQIDILIVLNTSEVVAKLPLGYKKSEIKGLQDLQL